MIETNLVIILCLAIFFAVQGDHHHKYSYKEKIIVKKMAKSSKSTMGDVAQRLNNFNFNFDEEIAKTNKGNVIFSPFSIYSALAMLGVGAEQKTKKEIASALGWHDTNFLPLLNMLAPLYRDLSKGEGSTLDIANKAWVGKNTDILQSYQENLMNYFNVTMGQEDFQNDPEAARQKINDWVAEKTGNNINNLFSPGSIETMTQLVIANAIYFKEEWENKFDVEDSYEDKFYLTHDNHLQVKFMFKHDKFSTAVDKENKVQLLQLPYAGSAYSMIFAIPIAKQDMNGEITHFDDLSVVEANIKDKTKVLQKWIQLLPDTNKVVSEIDIYVPKFEMNFGLNLLPHLENLGIKDVFVPGVANLSGISNKDLYVSSAFHKAFIKVDEEGTEAAAATGVAANTYSMVQPQEVFLNHPFLFYIVHRDTNTVIFSGKIQDPSKLE